MATPDGRFLPRRAQNNTNSDSRCRPERTLRHPKAGTPRTFNVKSLNVKRIRGNYSLWKMLFRSHGRTTFGRGNGVTGGLRPPHLPAAPSRMHSAAGGGIARVWRERSEGASSRGGRPRSWVRSFPGARTSKRVTRGQGAGPAHRRPRGSLAGPWAGETPPEAGFAGATERGRQGSCPGVSGTGAASSPPPGCPRWRGTRRRASGP